MSESQNVNFSNIWWESANSARVAQIEYGRWIVNTLWLMHSGAIAGILSKWDGKGIPPQSSALLFFVTGIILAFVTASIAWLNFTVADDWFRRWTYAGADWSDQKVEKHQVWLRRTMYGAIVAVVGSVLCLVLGALSVLRPW